MSVSSLIYLPTLIKIEGTRDQLKQMCNMIFSESMDSEMNLKRCLLKESLKVFLIILFAYGILILNI